MKAQAVVIGLGNPGPEYVQTRHNLGFLVIDNFSDRFKIKVNKKGFSCLWGKFKLENKLIILALPQTFMNLSGQAAKSLFSYFHPEKIVVAYDDLDIDYGRLKVSVTGSAGGHKGLQSILKYLPEQEITRLRVGIGRPEHNEPVDKYVLDRFYDSQKPLLSSIINNATDCLEEILKHGSDRSMQNFNGKIISQ